MEFKIECPWCNQHYSVDDSFIGQNVECSVCGKEFVVRRPNDSVLDKNTKTTDSFQNERIEDKHITTYDYNKEVLPERKNRIRFIAFSVLVLLIPVCIALCFICYKTASRELAGRNYRKGKISFDEHRYEDAVNSFQKAAEFGYSEAQLMLGMCYFNGDGIKRDYDEAVKWFRRAAEQNNLQAQFKLGVCYFGGIGVNRREDEALYWLQKAAKQGNHEAQIYLGDYYYDKGKTLENFSEALKWYQKGEETGIISDENKARILMCMTFQEAYNGDAKAQLAVFLAYEGELFGIKQDESESQKWLMESANSGNPQAQGLLGAALMKKGNEEEALKWLNKAGEQEDANAMLILAQYYTEKARKHSLRDETFSAHFAYQDAQKWINKLQAIDAKSSSKEDKK